MKRLLLSCALSLPLLAQIPPPNAAGVSMGHHHLIVKDVAAHKKIWIDVLGGQLSGNPPIEFVKFPGAFLILTQGNNTGNSEESAIDHFAFAVKDYNGTRDRLAAAGVQITRDRQEGQREFVAIFPDGIKAEFYEDTSLTTPIAHHHIHFSTNDPEGLRAWYVKAFGAEVRQEGNRTIVSIPGTMLSFRRVDAPAKPTQGRALDHTGFNVPSVSDFCAKLVSMNINCERPRGAETPIAMVTDPAGTRIELNQGLEAR